MSNPKLDPRTAWTRRSLAQAGLGLSLPAMAPASSGAAPPFEAILESNVRVRMRDGVRLATDIYRPGLSGRPADGRFPAIMERTPYGRNVTSFRNITATSATPLTQRQVAEIYVSQGFAVIFQDCRGRYDSEGEFEKYVNEGADGFDTCAWLAQQPWFDGRLGTMGLSYAAHTQVALACLRPPILRSMFVDCGGFSNAFQDGIRQGGAFELKQVTWAYNLGLESKEAQADPNLKRALAAMDLKAWFASMPWKRGHTPLSPLPGYEDYVYQQWEHGRFDDYWKRVGLCAEGYYDRFADVAQTHMSGWYDAYSRTAVDNYVGLSRQGRAELRLIMGPWTHGARSTSHSGDVEFGPTATIDALAGEDFFHTRLDWFERTLKSGPGGPSTPPVRLFVMGGGSGRKTADGRLDHGGRWRSEAAWPIPDRRETAFYLHASGELSSTAPAAGGGPLSFDFDPGNPVPTIGGAVTSGEPLMHAGGFDQRTGPDVYGARPPFLPLDARPDVLVFQTPPLEADTEVTGAIRAHLWIASDAPDTDFTFKLIDLYPPSDDYPGGFALNLTDAILRCRYRDSWTDPSLMTPGQVCRITLEAFPTSNLFKRGHRIRLDVSSSNFPRFDVNPNTGAPEGTGLVRRIARNTVFSDAGRPSHVILPIIPERA
jgi:uncharacterized protein